MKDQWTIGVVAVAVFLGGWAAPAQAECTFNAEPGDVFINEIFAQPKTAAAGKEWFEVVNLNSGSRCLFGMKVKFTDQGGATQTSEMRSDVTVNGRGGVVWFGEYPDKTSSDPLRSGETRFSLKDGSGSIEIQKPNGSILHKIQYQNAPVGQSLNFYLAYACKPPDCVGLGKDDKGTPGAGNTNQYTQ
ncbi:MAG: hypothetical protein ABIK09_14730 [Pseudomonadota bacterium]